MSTCAPTDEAAALGYNPGDVRRRRCRNAILRKAHGKKTARHLGVPLVQRAADLRQGRRRTDMQAGSPRLSHPRRYPGDVGRRGARARARRGREVIFRVVIPARYGSTRLPGKPLQLLAGKTMLQHVHERALESGAAEVVIATDDERIREAAVGFGANVCMTAAAHRSGTDRLAEVAARGAYAPDDIIVNLQGDEPLMPAVLIRQVADDLAAHEAASIATLCARLTAVAELFDPKVVKVGGGRAGGARGGGRAPGPGGRGAGGRGGGGGAGGGGGGRRRGGDA